MIRDGSDLFRVVAALLYSGVFWTVTLRLVDGQASRESRAVAAAVLVLAVYLFMSVVTDRAPVPALAATW